MIVSPSLLAADKNNLPFEAMKMKDAGATYIHIDIMDGKFVPATTWDHHVVEELSSHTHGLVLDTHLMIEDPISYVDNFIGAGSNVVTVHLEAFKSKEEAIVCLRHIREKGVVPGISIKPLTPVESLLPYLKEVGLVLVMSVEPGKGGQAFMPSSLEKIAFLSHKKKELHLDYLIEVDGGINGDTGLLCAKNGVEILVAGSYLYGKEDYKQRLEALLSL